MQKSGMNLQNSPLLNFAIFTQLHSTVVNGRHMDDYLDKKPSRVPVFAVAFW
jgi:hypothetical protein